MELIDSLGFVKVVTKVSSADKQMLQDIRDSADEVNLSQPKT